ncbi:hypothetical protein EJB05_54942, partial [Eragrostis curvula]
MGDAPAAINNVTVGLHLALELVFLRLPSLADLVRAAAACKPWRRVIADAGFLRLFRALNPPPAAGDYFNGYHSIASPSGPVISIRPSFVPSPSTTIPAINAGRFSLDFLPDDDAEFPPDWRILDSRGSLVLIVRRGPRYDHYGFPDMLVVCEPLTRRYRRIPPPANFGSHRYLWGSYLVDGDADEAGGCINMSNFRVHCEFYRACVAHATVFFTGGTGSWTERTIDHVVPDLNGRRLLGRAGDLGRTLVVLDGHTGEYSPFVLPDTEDWPPNLRNFNFCITDGRDGKPCILSIVGSTLKVFARLGSGNGEWAPEKRVSLPEATVGLPGYDPSAFDLSPVIWTTGSGLVTLLPHARVRWLFSVDLETMEAKPAEDEIWDMLYRCELPWPPTLHACT